MDGGGYGYVSYRSSSTIMSEGVYQFLRGSLYGAMWGLVTPFHAPGSAGAAAEAATGIFKPAPPFSSLRSVPSNAAIFGTVLGIQRISAKSVELMRRKSDIWNELFGYGVTYAWYTKVLAKSETRLMMHNRGVGIAVLAAIVYANVMV